MMTNTDRTTDPEDFPVEMTLPEYIEILSEIEEQAPWRTNADKEMDYVDGNQLNSELLQKQAAVGIPPAVEDLMGPALRALPASVHLFDAGTGRTLRKA